MTSSVKQLEMGNSQPNKLVNRVGSANSNIKRLNLSSAKKKPMRRKNLPEEFGQVSNDLERNLIGGSSKNRQTTARNLRRKSTLSARENVADLKRREKFDEKQTSKVKLDSMKRTVDNDEHLVLNRNTCDISRPKSTSSLPLLVQLPTPRLASDDKRQFDEMDRDEKKSYGDDEIRESKGCLLISGQIKPALEEAGMKYDSLVKCEVKATQSELVSKQGVDNLIRKCGHNQELPQLTSANQMSSKGNTREAFVLDKSQQPVPSNPATIVKVPQSPSTSSLARANMIAHYKFNAGNPAIRSVSRMSLLGSSASNSSFYLAEDQRQRVKSWLESQPLIQNSFEVEVSEFGFPLSFLHMKFAVY